MCLDINIGMHPGKKPQPRIASTDLLVWKGLDRVNENGGRSPYRGAQWTFGHTKRAKLGVFSSSYRPGVDAGLHACLSATRAETHGTDAVPAIIPKGSEFYYGRFGEIVANKMVAYRDIKDALKGRELGKPDPYSHKLKKKSVRANSIKWTDSVVIFS